MSFLDAVLHLELLAHAKEFMMCFVRAQVKLGATLPGIGELSTQLETMVMRDETSLEI